MTTSLINDMNDPEFRKLLAQEELILEVTETICELLEKEKGARKERAHRLGKSKGFVSQLLSGGRNLTLRTVADILHVLGYKVSLTPYKEGWQRQESNVIDIQTRQNIRKSPAERWGQCEISTSIPDNYISKAISG